LISHHRGVKMKKQMVSTEDFEPPSPVYGLGAMEARSVPDSLPQREKPKIISIAKVPQIPRFKSSARTTAFRKRFFPDTTSAEWNDWQWQLRHRIKDVHALSTIIALSDDERRAMTSGRATPSGNHSLLRQSAGAGQSTSAVAKVRRSRERRVSSFAGRGRGPPWRRP
jgi:hypothetical protein